MHSLAWAKQTRFLILSFVSLFLIKVTGYFLSDRTDWHNMPGDAEQYDAFAMGLDDKAYSVWSWALRFLYEIGFYSREGISAILFLLGSLIIPVLLACLVKRGRTTCDHDRSGGTDTWMFWLVAIVVGLYPPLLYFSLDIYRDVFMVFMFCLGLLALKASIEGESAALRYTCLVLALGFAYVLYLLRPYLGFSFVAASAGMYVFRLRTARLWIWTVLYLFGLWILFSTGMLDAIAVEYRAGFSRVNAGSNFDIQFDSILLFIPQFLQSGLYQIGGFYFPKSMAWFPFVLESVPFMVMAGYIVKNRRYANRFVDFLTVFFIAYATVWVLGNDNLGTAIRLRMFNYLAVMVAWGIVVNNKRTCKPNTAEQKVPFLRR